jgi:hypothetical protein
MPPFVVVVKGIRGVPLDVVVTSRGISFKHEQSIFEAAIVTFQQESR